MKKKLIVRNDALNVGLPKWPALLVSGKRVDTDTAAEILIRTDYTLPDYSYALNDRDFANRIMGLFGAKRPRSGTDSIKESLTYYDKIDTLRKRMNKLNLSYVTNSRIGSSYIGGPHGWCDWDGNIFCNSYNIGKHPSAEEVANDWLEISSAFPMLQLRCQLLSEESIEGDDGIPLVEYIISDGTVTVLKPVAKMLPVIVDIFSSMVMLAYPGREHGITIELLKSKLIDVYGEIPQYE